ncbi:MAG: M28 family peptidase [Candidatus Rokubacteria bacterium]|nr:M28 family peptidase [Candidatus Rokubacteria bacterium]
MSLRALVLVLALTATQACATAPSPQSPTWLLEQVKRLSAPDTEGRASGTEGADRAAAHAVSVFRQAGLRPGGDAGGYLQPFQVTTGIRLGPANALRILAPAPLGLTLGRDYTPLAVSADGTVESDLVFAGYGITAPELGYDDYAGLEVRDRVVLVLSREPRGRDPSSPFRRPEAYHYSERSHKVINARQHGARAILLVEHPEAEAERLPRLAGISQPWGVLAAFVTRAVADSLLAPAGKKLGALAAAIDQAMAPRSLSVAGMRVRLEVSLTRERGTAVNVVGILPGTDPALADQAVLIGAHYDHLGRGGEGSLAPDLLGTIHPGADDNASGTAAVLGMARAFAAAGGAPRTLVFVAFAGEEMGLLGSAHQVAHPPLPLDRIALMLNLDMVGRLREGKLYASGVDSGTGLRALVTEAARGLPLDLQLRGDPHAPSDHTSFYARGRPVVFLTTGAHEEYHRPSDTWEKISAPGLETVTAFATRLVGAVAAAPAAPTYVKIEAPPARGPRAGGYGPYLGVIPEFGEAPRPGVKVSSVRAGSPAEKAGVRAGDLIVRFGPVTVKTLNDLTFALRAQRPGDRVELRLLRDGAEERVEAVLQERRQ